MAYGDQSVNKDGVKRWCVTADPSFSLSDLQSIDEDATIDYEWTTTFNGQKPGIFGVASNMVGFLNAAKIHAKVKSVKAATINRKDPPSADLTLSRAEKLAVNKNKLYQS